MNLPGDIARRVRGCPPGWQITRAVSEDDAAVQAHIEACPTCAAEVRRLRELVNRASALATTDVMSHESRQAVSAWLLSRGPMAPVAPWRFIQKPLRLGVLGGAALAMVWGVWVLARRDRPANTPAATMVSGSKSEPKSTTNSGTTPGTTAGTTSRSFASVRALDAARFSRIAPPPDERILLQEGVIVLDVTPLARGQRFRIVTDDAEVEVRGTHFEVSASHGRLMAVRVTTGRVQVRSTRGALVTLDAGDEWVGRREDRAGVDQPQTGAGAGAGVGAGVGVGAGPTGASEKSAPASIPARVAHPPGASTTALPHIQSPSRRNQARNRDRVAAASFARAWDLLRKGDAQAAASAFADLERVTGDSSLQEDACYWRAVAVGRSGDSSTARRLFDQFLRRFPASARRGEASVALGWLLLESGDNDGARAAFERAASDPSGRVRARALEGIGRLGPR